jgi:uncharacterized damage-inducible protein DinB
VNQVQDAGGLTQVGADGWTVKDHLAHIAAWEQSLLGLIEGRDRSLAMGLSEPLAELDSINEAIRNLHQNDTVDEAFGYFRDSHAQLVAALGKLSNADLQSRTATTSRATRKKNGRWPGGSAAIRMSTTPSMWVGSIS